VMHEAGLRGRGGREECGDPVFYPIIDPTSPRIRRAARMLPLEWPVPVVQCTGAPPGCPRPCACNTLRYMDSTLNVRIPPALKRQLDALSRRTHRSSSELVRESLRRYLATEQLAAVRRMTMPLAEARGFVTDEDVFKAIS
ncbi:MAG: CopG family ribbon-helix-helix protein, partial [Planctomycetia bacterium]